MNPFDDRKPEKPYQAASRKLVAMVRRPESLGLVLLSFSQFRREECPNE
jgi:hypothetical protein